MVKATHKINNRVGTGKEDFGSFGINPKEVWIGDFEVMPLRVGMAGVKKILPQKSASNLLRQHPEIRDRLFFTPAMPTRKGITSNKKKTKPEWLYFYRIYIGSLTNPPEQSGQAVKIKIQYFFTKYF